MAETWIADQWLYQTLKNDTTLANLVGGTADPRIYADMAPSGASMPYVVYENEANDDVQGIGAVIIMVDSIYTVRGVDATDTYGGVLSQISDRIQALLHDVAGTAGTGRVLASTRISPYRFTEQRDGKVWRHLGGIYRLYPQE